VRVHEIADPNWLKKDHLVHGDRYRRTAAVASSSGTSDRVDKAHDNATVHGAQQVDVK
jgi:hypothetical protein